MSHKIEGTPPPAVRSTGPVGGRGLVKSTSSEADAGG